MAEVKQPMEQYDSKESTGSVAVRPQGGCSRIYSYIRKTGYTKKNGEKVIYQRLVQFEHIPAGDKLRKQRAILRKSIMTLSEEKINSLYSKIQIKNPEVPSEHRLNKKRAVVRLNLKLLDESDF